VPPTARVVDASPCENGWKRRGSSAASTPLPVSATASRTRPRAGAGDDADAALDGELDRVGDEVAEDLADPHRVAGDDGGEAGRDLELERQPLASVIGRYDACTAASSSRRSNALDSR
jgi:hypothetical protein